LPRENPDLDLRLIEPTAVGRRVTNVKQGHTSRAISENTSVSDLRL
jgi:hypothetical protein